MTERADNLTPHPECERCHGRPWDAERREFHRAERARTALYVAITGILVTLTQYIPAVVKFLESVER